VFAFDSDPYRTELTVAVIRVAAHDARTYVVLDDTILYPEGGGQPADHGWIGAATVVDVRRCGDEIRHYLDRPPGDGDAVLRLDWERRFDHMQQHTAQHLITALAADELGWQTTSFHLGATESDIELDAPDITDDDLRRLEEQVAERIRQARPVTSREVSPETFQSLEVRTRGLPRGHHGDIRLVEIDGVDCNTCGGTHVASTAEIESVVLLGTESRRGGTRLHWIAGGRVRRRLHQQERHAAAIRHAFETSDEEVVQVAEAKLGRLKEAEREVKSLRASLAQQAAAGLLASSDTVLDAHFDDADAGFLQLVARQLVNAGGHRAALLTAEGPGGAFFVVCAPREAGLDLRPAGARVAELFGGRGGGSPELIQGKAASLRRRADAKAVLLAEG